MLWHALATALPCQMQKTVIALFNPETSILTQKRHPYTGNLNSETRGTVRTRFYIVDMF